MVVVLAKRGGPDRYRPLWAFSNAVSSGADVQKSSAARRTQAIKFPRKYGQGKAIRLGCRELGETETAGSRAFPRQDPDFLSLFAAAFIRVVQLLLEGLASSTVSTKRDLFYRDVSLFRKQAVVDSVRRPLPVHVRVC